MSSAGAESSKCFGFDPITYISPLDNLNYYFCSTRYRNTVFVRLFGPLQMYQQQNVERLAHASNSQWEQLGPRQFSTHPIGTKPRLTWISIRADRCDSYALWTCIPEHDKFPSHIKTLSVMGSLAERPESGERDTEQREKSSWQPLFFVYH